MVPWPYSGPVHCLRLVSYYYNKLTQAQTHHCPGVNPNSSRTVVKASAVRSMTSTTSRTPPGTFQALHRLRARASIFGRRLRFTCVAGEQGAAPLRGFIGSSIDLGLTFTLLSLDLFSSPPSAVDKVAVASSRNTRRWHCSGFCVVASQIHYLYCCHLTTILGPCA